MQARLQKVQNNAAREVIVVKKRYDHITPVIKDLHGPSGRGLSSIFCS